MQHPKLKLSKRQERRYPFAGRIINSSASISIIELMRGRKKRPHERK